MPSDMWSMGVILYALITCTLPFMADTVKETNNLVVNSEERYDQNEWTRFKEEAKSLVKGLLEKDPKKRLTAEQVLQHPWLQDLDLMGNVVKKGIMKQIYVLDDTDTVSISSEHTDTSPSAYYNKKDVKQKKDEIITLFVQERKSKKKKTIC